MSVNPTKVDGIGTRKDGSGGDVLNTATDLKIRRYEASEAIAAGDLVAFDLNGTEPTRGYGNVIKVCDTGDALNGVGFGVALEAIASGAVGDVQVQGICSTAKVDVSDATDGKLLGPGSTSGLLDLFDTSAAFGSGGDALPVAICVVKGASDGAVSKVYLLNCLNQ